uniref:ATP synthase F0 subunit 8 n=1 Tax=Cryptacrus comes TaxID=2080389 RepID=A0A2P1CLS5_9HEMI|nr:ATP synthase F0 subunit 8 [Cryptacrus comes]
MPQMSPLYWETLFIMFIMSMIMMKMIIYHIPQTQLKKNSMIEKDIKQNNWKW